MKFIDLYNQMLMVCFFLLLFFGIHIIVWQFKSKKGKGLILITVISAFSYLLVVVFHNFYLKYGLKEHVWVTCPIVMFFIMLYLHFYVGMDRSVSIRILGELVNSKSRKLSFKELDVLYPKEQMFKSRLDLLVDKNWLVRGDGKYYCSKKGRCISRFVIYLKKIYSLETTG
mgnify:FL=1